MPYIGKAPSVQNIIKLDSITASATASYTMQRDGANYSPQNINSMLVSLNGIIQSPGTSFTISGSTISFASSLSSSDSIDFILVYGDVLDTGVPSDSSITNAKLNTAPTLISKGGGGEGGAIQLNCEVNTHGVKLKSPDHSAGQSWTLKLPDNSPTADKILKVKSITGSGATAVGQMEFVDEPSGYYKLLTTTTASGASSVVFDSSLMTNTYKHFMITGNAFHAGADNSFLSYRESSDNGNTHSFTGYNAYLYTTLGTNSTGGYGDSTSGYFYIGSWNSGSGKPCFAQWDLYNFAHAEPTGGFKKYRVKCFQHNANANV